MSAILPKQRRVLSYREQIRYKQQLKDEERRLNGELVVPLNKKIRESMPYRRLNRMARFIDPTVREDPYEIQRRIFKLNRTLRLSGPRHLTRIERNRMEKRIKQDREWLRKNMITQRMNKLRRGQHGFGKAVQYCAKEHSETFKRIAERYKNNMREYAPDDPDSHNIENIRPK